jgi:hypothetical protein
MVPPAMFPAVLCAVNNAKNGLAPPDYNPAINYYQEFWRLYLQNETLLMKIRDAGDDNKKMMEKVNDMKNAVKFVESKFAENRIKKKQRRKATQIDKVFKAFPPHLTASTCCVSVLMKVVTRRTAPKCH